MNSMNANKLSLLLVMLCMTLPALTTVRVPSLFSDHLVLQRQKSIPVWGWAAANEAVTVTLRTATGQALASRATTTGETGTWRVDLPAMRAHTEPLTLTIAGTNTITLRDVLVGEVWLASGQSNMGYALAGALRAKEEIAAATHPNIRFFIVELDATPTPLNDCRARWWTSTPHNAPYFSAVAYFFARELAAKLDVPVGILQAPRGATTIEAWTPWETLKTLPALQEQVMAHEQKLAEFAAHRPERLQEYTAAVARSAEAWRQWNGQIGAQDTGVQDRWYAPEIAAEGWQPVTLPFPPLENPLNASPSILWFRKEVEIPQQWVGQELTLRYRLIYNYDVGYVNGEEVGRVWTDTDWLWGVLREYRIPARLVTATRLTIALRVMNQRGRNADFLAPDDMLLDAGDGRKVSLAGDWRYREGLALNATDFPSVPIPQLPGSTQAEPSTLYNAMIHPLAPYRFRGFLWYQGEGNAAAPDAYRELFPALIRSWRAKWGQPDLPFYFVQLANIMDPQTRPIELNSWADIRDVQAEALSLPATGMAVTIDIGEAWNVHAKNKQDVGKRLALCALAKTYRKKVPYSGPRVTSLTTTGGQAVLTFDTGSGALVAKDGPLRSFAIAGADKVFYRAEARIEGRRVIVSSPQVAQPVAVRYGWANNPPCNLYNAAGLPAAPFRTDRWQANEIAVADETVTPQQP